MTDLEEQFRRIAREEALRVIDEARPDELLTAREAAAFAKCSVDTIRRMAGDGRLEHHRINGTRIRVSRRALELALRTKPVRARVDDERPDESDETIRRIARGVVR